MKGPLAFEDIANEEQLETAVEDVLDDEWVEEEED
jgi:hypothetical protein